MVLGDLISMASKWLWKKRKDSLVKRRICHVCGQSSRAEDSYDEVLAACAYHASKIRECQ